MRQKCLPIVRVEHNDDSFKNMSLKEKTATVIGFTLFIILVTGFVLGIYFFGFAGVFALLGVHYQSVWSLVIFVVSFFILGFLVDLFFGALAELVTEKITGNEEAFLIQMLFGFVLNWLVLATVDAFMESISLSLQTKLIVSLLLTVLESVFDNKKGRS